MIVEEDDWIKKHVILFSLSVVLLKNMRRVFFDLPNYQISTEA